LWDQIGIILSIIGSLISVAGSIENNIFRRHQLAMQIWGYGSNPVLLIWSLGLSLHWWDGGLSGLPLVGMYFVFSTSNLYGLIKK
jgi:hypothetical protein